MDVVRGDTNHGAGSFFSREFAFDGEQFTFAAVQSAFVSVQ